MALITSKIIKVIAPPSYLDSNLEEYEWLLEWYNRYGTPTYYLFKDWNAEDIVETNPINVDTDDIKSLITSQERNVSLIAEDIKRADLIAFKHLQVAKNVSRISLDGARERIAIKSSSITYINSKQRYSIELMVQRRQEPLII